MNTVHFIYTNCENRLYNFYAFLLYYYMCVQLHTLCYYEYVTYEQYVNIYSLCIIFYELNREVLTEVCQKQNSNNYDEKNI